MHPKTENITIASLVGITGLVGLLLTLPSVSAETEAVDTITITVPSACSMTPTVGTTHTATVDSGTYVADIGETTLKTICNDSNGFSIYAIGYTDDTYGNTKLKSSVGATSDVDTGTATSGNTSNWAMKLTAVSNNYTPTILSDTDGTFSDYHVIPSTYTKVATIDSVTDTTNGSNIKTTYAVYMNPTQPAGAYEGKVKYTLVHPASEGAPTIPVSISDVEYMQDVNTCPATLTTGQVYTIKDSRDNQDYKVAKLADGKCWMVENLNLAGGTAIESTKSDVDASYISSFSTSNNLTKDTTNNTIVLPASSTSGFNKMNYSYVYNSGNKTNCGAADQDTPCYSYYSWDAATLGSGRSIGTDNTDAPYSICPKGWRLSTSGSISSNDWKRGDFYVLATAYGADLESRYYDSLTNTSANFYNNAGPGTTPNFLLAGYYSGSFGSGGSNGYYWSATSASSTSYAHYLHFNSRFVYSARIDNRSYGYSVRCVFSE